MSRTKKRHLRNSQQLWLMVIVIAGALSYVLPISPAANAQGTPVTYSCNLATNTGNGCALYSNVVDHREPGTGIVSAGPGSQYIYIDIVFPRSVLSHAEVTTCIAETLAGGADGSAEAIYDQGNFVDYISYADRYTGCVTHEWNGNATANYIFVNPSAGTCSIPSCLTVTDFSIDITTTTEPTESYAEPPQPCAVLGDNNANFISPTDWSFTGDASYYQTAPDRVLNLGPGGAVTLNTSALNPTTRYGFKIIYQALQSGNNGSITVTINDQAISVPVLSNEDPQIYERPPSLFAANNGYAITLQRPPSDTGEVNIFYFCVKSEIKAGSVGGSFGGQIDGCEICDPPLSIYDIIGILNWIICNIRRLFTCYLIPALGEWLKFLVTLVRYALSFIVWVITFLGSFISWLGNIIGAVFTWLGTVISQVVAFISSFLRNLITAIANGFHTSGIAGGLNIMASDARDLPTMLANGIGSLGAELQDIFSTSTDLVTLVLRLIVLAAQAIAYFIGLIPLVIQSLIDGINSSGAPVSGSPVCSDSNNVLYFPCLGFYVLDNTLFTGPVRFLIPVLIGVVIFDTLTWAFNRIKEELSK